VGEQPFPDHQWQPIPPEEVAALLSDAPFRWYLAGGYAIERFVGSACRDHSDTDIVVARPDQVALQTQLAGWHLYAADPPGTLRPWLQGEFLPVGVHDIWGYRAGREAWELQVMLQEVDGDRWWYRREPSIGGPLAELVVEIDGIPCLRPEFQLFYKSKGLREKDREDFRRCLPRLDARQRGRLGALMREAYPEGHDWLDRLAFWA
jgi:hypothetical protein